MREGQSKRKEAKEEEGDKEVERVRDSGGTSGIKQLLLLSCGRFTCQHFSEARHCLPPLTPHHTAERLNHPLKGASDSSAGPHSHPSCHCPHEEPEGPAVARRWPDARSMDCCCAELSSLNQSRAGQVCTDNPTLASLNSHLRPRETLP